MARVVVFVPDLLFGSTVMGQLRAAGHEVTLAGSDDAALAALADGADALVVDLTVEAPARCALVSLWRGGGKLGPARTVAFYSHVEGDTRALALAAGFDAVVPRSRMAREGAEVVAGVVGAG